MITQSELNKALDELGPEHAEAFERWYEQANFPDIKHYCFIGWVLERYLPRDESR